MYFKEMNEKRKQEENIDKRSELLELLRKIEQNLILALFFRVFIPDENLVWCPEQLMTAVLAHVHYLPESWRGQAHTHNVRSHFAQIFQYKAVSCSIKPIFCIFIPPSAN